MVRVIAGSARGRRLKTPKGEGTRPTLDRVKESLFSSLGERVVDAVVLDLFAGTGALGIEALSRGAARALFVEGERGVARMLTENVAACGFQDRALVLVAWIPPRRPLPEGWAPFDLVFMDPPYGRGLVLPALEWLVGQALVRRGGWVVVEHGAKEEMPSKLKNLTVVRAKTFGDTAVSVLESG